MVKPQKDYIPQNFWVKPVWLLQRLANNAHKIIDEAFSQIQLGWLTSLYGNVVLHPILSPINFWYHLVIPPKTYNEAKDVNFSSTRGQYYDSGSFSIVLEISSVLSTTSSNQKVNQGRGVYQGWPATCSRKILKQSNWATQNLTEHELRHYLLNMQRSWVHHAKNNYPRIFRSLCSIPTE